MKEMCKRHVSYTVVKLGPRALQKRGGGAGNHIQVGRLDCSLPVVSKSEILSRQDGKRLNFLWFVVAPKGTVVVLTKCPEFYLSRVGLAWDRTEGRL